MIKVLAALALGYALLLCAKVAVAQEGPSPAERERICAHQAAERGLVGIPLKIFMNRCMGRRGSSATPPTIMPQAPRAPESRRGVECTQKGA